MGRMHHPASTGVGAEVMMPWGERGRASVSLAARSRRGILTGMESLRMLSTPASPASPPSPKNRRPQESIGSPHPNPQHPPWAKPFPQHPSAGSGAARVRACLCGHGSASRPCLASSGGRGPSRRRGRRRSLAARCRSAGGLFLHPRTSTSTPKPGDINSASLLFPSPPHPGAAFRLGADTWG